MSPFWLDRDRVDRDVQTLKYEEAEYDPGSGLYLYKEQPYTGSLVQRYEDGKLENLVQLIDGANNGVTVVWYPNGMICSYGELQRGARHGAFIEWDESGNTIRQNRYHHGELIEQ